MNPARLAQRNAPGVVLTVLFLAVLGGLAFSRMPASILPAFPFPRLAVIISAGDLAIQDMLLRVTRPMEEAASGVPGAKRVHSETSRGALEMSVDFDWGTDMFEAYTRLNANVAAVRSGLPPQASVLVERMDPSSFPVIGYSLTSDRQSPRELREIATLELAPTLRRLDGVYRVMVQGGRQREYQVVLEPEALARLGITPAQVSQALAQANVLESVGRFSHHYQGYLILVTGQVTRAEQLLDVVVTRAASRMVRVRDVGRVVEGDRPVQQVVTADGREAVLLSILQQPGASTGQVSAEVRAELDRLLPTLPTGARIKSFYDEADLLHDSLGSLRDSIIVGAFLSVCVLLLFLRSWRSVLVVLVCLPITVCITFLGLQALGQSLNLMTLGALAVGLGLIIDDVVVTLENIHRHLEMGKTPLEAAQDGSAEILKPMLGSTLSTVAVFAPLAFLSEITGAFFSPLSLTLTLLLVISVALAVTLVPVAAARVLKQRRGAPREHSSAPGVAYRGLRALQEPSLRHPWVVVALTIALAATATVVFPTLPSGFMPDMDEGAFVLDYRGASGATLEDTDRQVRIIEAEILRTPEIDSYSRRLGLEMGFFSTEPNRGDIMLKLKPRSARRRSMREVMVDVEERCSARLPGMTLEAIAPIADRVADIAGEPSPVEVKLYGEDPRKLQELGEKAAAIVAKVRGTSESIHEVAIAGPELEIRIDPRRAGALGLTARSVSDALRSALEGAEDTVVVDKERLIGVRVLYPQNARRRLEQIAQLPLITPEGRRVPVASVAELREVAGVYQAIRENQMPMVPVTAALVGRDLGSANAEVRQRLAAELKLPKGYSLQYGGLSFTQQRSFAALLTALLMGSALVFIVTLFQYGRFQEPLALILASALALTSVVFILKVTGTPFNASSFTGAIMIFGMVLTNGIVLMDTIRLETQSGADLAGAILTAGQRRLRPVLMTAAIAILALLPLSLGIGAGAEMQQPLAIAVIGGLLTAPLFTLIVSPVLLVALRTPPAREVAE